MDKKMSFGAVGIVLLAVIVIVGLSLRTPPPSKPAATAVETQNLDPVRTEAVETFAAGLTSTSLAIPAATATGTQAATATAAASPGPSPTGGPSPTPDCLALHFVRDVTIPDNTPMTPAQVFTKSWLVENSGTCPWQAGYQVVLIGGIAMGGSPYQFIQDVTPGGRIQISIKMVAPTNQTGIVQGTWKMADANGKTFGDYMSVVIVVSSGTGPPPTAAATPTKTP